MADFIAAKLVWLGVCCVIAFILGFIEAVTGPSPRERERSDR